MAWALGWVLDMGWTGAIRGLGWIVRFTTATATTIVSFGIPSHARKNAAKRIWLPDRTRLEDLICSRLLCPGSDTAFGGIRMVWIRGRFGLVDPACFSLLYLFFEICVDSLHARIYA